MQRRVNVPEDIAFAVAADVASYKDFLPLLQRSSIRGPRQRTVTGESFEAELAVSYPKLGLNEVFVSAVTTHIKDRNVKAVSTDGPFRRVETVWTIAPAPSGSDVTIRIDYAFRNPLLQIAASGLMDMAISKVLSAFEARARQLLAQRHALEQV
jgi:coenzyme Q-binding protein COQ10